MSFSLSRLPPELWIEIFLTLRDVEGVVLSGQRQSDKTTLRSVSLACHALHGLVEPLIFHRLRLSNRTPELEEVARHLIDLLTSRDEMLGWIQDLTIQIHALDTTAQLGRNISDIFVKMTELRRVQIDHMDVTGGMWAHIHDGLATLNEFVCWNIGIGEEAAEGVDPSHLRIRQLTINEIRRPDRQSIAKLALSPTLNYLHISATIAPYVYQLPVESCWPSKLETMEVPEPSTASNAQAFFSFSRNHPSITSLRFNRRFDSEEPIYAPDGEVMPALVTLYGAHSIVSLMVPGRPVEDLEVTGQGSTSLTRECLYPLSLSSVPLRRLHLNNFRWEPHAFGAITELFPALRELLLWLVRVEPAALWIRTGLTAEITRLPQLQSFRIFSTNPPSEPLDSTILDERQMQLDMLYQMKSTNPQLIDVGFWGRTQWRWEGLDPRWVSEGDLN